MEDIFFKGYVCKVFFDQNSFVKGIVWYILYYGVYYFCKLGKICVVFDCLVKFMGKFFNDMLYKGLDLISLFVGVLLRFCEERVVVMVDIEFMFY